MGNRASSFVRAFAWALLAAVFGTVFWILLVATVAPLVGGEGPGKMIGWWTTRSDLALYFGGFIAVLAIVPHAVLFAGWQAIVHRRPACQRSIGRPVISSFLLSLPLVIVVFVGYAARSYGLGPFWSEAFGALPWVLLSTWGGILLARRLLEYLWQWTPPVAA